MKTAAYYVKTEGCQAFQTHMCINARSSHIAGDWLENLRQKPTWRRKTAFATIPKFVEMRDDSSSQGCDGTIRPPAVLLGTSKLSSHIARTRCTRGCLAKVGMAPRKDVDHPDKPGRETRRRRLRKLPGPNQFRNLSRPRIDQYTSHSIGTFAKA